MNRRKYRKQFMVLHFHYQDGAVYRYLVKKCPQCSYKAKTNHIHLPG